MMIMIIICYILLCEIYITLGINASIFLGSPFALFFFFTRCLDRNSFFFLLSSSTRAAAATAAAATIVYSNIIHRYL